MTTTAQAPHPYVAEAEQTMSHARRWQLIRAIEDWAASWHNLSWTRGSEARYIAEANQATSQEWEWIAHYITQHPQVLTSGPVAEPGRAAAQAARKTAADWLSVEALAAWKEDNQPARALDLIRQAQTLTPADPLWERAIAAVTADAAPVG